MPELVNSAGRSAPGAAADERPRRVGVLPLLEAFGTIGITSFGGARAAYFRHVLVVSRGWIDDHQFLEALTIAQILPGPNVSNLTACLGQRLRGVLGAAVAALGFLLPGALMILALAIFYFGHGNIPAVSAVFKGVGAAAVGLSAATVWQVGRPSVSGARDVIIIVVTFLAIALLRLNLLIPFVTIAPLSVWLCRPRPADVAGAPKADGGQQNSG